MGSKQSNALSGGSGGIASGPAELKTQMILTGLQNIERIVSVELHPHFCLLHMIPITCPPRRVRVTVESAGLLSILMSRVSAVPNATFNPCASLVGPSTAVADRWT